MDAYHIAKFETVKRNPKENETMLTLGKQSPTHAPAFIFINAGHGAMAKKAKDSGIDIDSQWFFDRLNAQKLSLRGLAKMIDMSPSSLSLRLDGQYKITMEEAAEMAPLLGVTFEEIVLHAGIKVPKAPGGGIKVIGSVGAGGVVKMAKGGGVVARPAHLPGDAVAIRDLETGWLYFYAPSHKLQPEAVGRLAVVEEGGTGGHKGGYKTVLGVLERGSERGVWDVKGVCVGGKGGSKDAKGGASEPCEGGVEGVKVGVASPVLLIMP